MNSRICIPALAGAVLVTFACQGPLSPDLPTGSPDSPTGLPSMVVVSTALFPTSCQDIRDNNPTATDGVFTIFPNGGVQTVSIFCFDMAGTPSEYLTLANTGGSFNFSLFGGESTLPPAVIVKTNYTKIRLNPATLLVNIGDQTFATSTGSDCCIGTIVITSMPYGTASACLAPFNAAGKANIDLTSTPFIVNDAFFTNGFRAAGSVSGVPGQVVNVTGGGFCGGTGPQGALVNKSGGFSLQLQYVGDIAIAVDIDIKPGSDPNSINLGSKGTIPVAILSTVDFDATTVDPLTVTLADAAVKVKGKGTAQAASKDVNGDGLLDLVVHVLTSGLALTTTATEAALVGETFGGTLIRGTDFVNVVR